MIILGIDPGTIVTGWGIVKKEGRKVSHVDNGVVVPPKGAVLPKKLEAIYNGIAEIIEKYKPEAAAIEEVFVANNARSALLLGHARGVAMLAASNGALPVYEYSARTVKQAIVGFGNAEKNQVAKMIARLLNLPEIAAIDASDALAVAFCHANTNLSTSQIVSNGPSQNRYLKKARRT